MTAKEILTDVINAFCLSSVNLDKALKLSGIKASLYNGKRSNEQSKKIFIRAINDDTAKDILNKMPFPYIETANGNWLKISNNWEDILVPLPKKKGYKLECVTEKYSIQYK